MKLQLNNFQQDDFLKNIWQKKPLLLKQALCDFENPLDGNELAGLSLEPIIESRIIQQITAKDGSTDWKVQHGPFTEDIYEKLPEKNWTLLIQAVDHYIDEVEALKQAFRFIPNWRLDDVMISYATQGGNVGPHFDQYDVFLIQASGKRRWKIGQHCDNFTALTNNPDVKILQNFQQESEYVLEAGDIMYVPPGCAHWGIADTDDCITISIGFRAPSHEEIIAQLCDDVASQLSDDLRYQDVAINPEQHPAEISQSVLDNVINIVKQHLLNSEAILHSFGKLMTEPKYADEQDPFISNNEILYKRLDTRIAYFKNGDTLTVFANGNGLQTNAYHENFIQNLSDSYSIDRNTLNNEEQELLEFFMQVGIFEDIDGGCDEHCTHDHDHDHHH